MKEKCVCSEKPKTSEISVISATEVFFKMAFPTIRGGEKWMQSQFSPGKLSLLIRETPQRGRCSGPLKMLGVVFIDFYLLLTHINKLVVMSRIASIICPYANTPDTCFSDYC